ncbi:MAG: dienelactone hydrolase [Parvicellaceae bacterium]
MVGIRKMKYLIQILLLGMVAKIAIAGKSLPITGEYSVGTKSYFIIDKNRSETLTKNTKDYRRVGIQAFFPSFKTDECMNQLDSPYGKKIKYIHCINKPIKPAIINEKYPVVILSPGFGGSYLMNLTLAEELASHGYYVINVGHTFFNSTPTFPDGKKIELMSMDTLKMESDDFLNEEFKTRLNTYIKIQKDDILSILNELANTLDKDHLNSIDLNNIACIGYSGGGATSAEICSADTRIKAGININGILYGDGWNDSITQPFLYINADYSDPKKAEIEMQGGQNVIDSLLSYYNRRKLRFSKNSNADFYELTLYNTTHQNFSDMALINQDYCGKSKPKKCFEYTYRYILLFLNKYLKKETSDELNQNNRTKAYYFEIIKTASNN